MRAARIAAVALVATLLGSTTADAVVRPPAAPAPAARTYVVRPGDNLAIDLLTHDRGQQLGVGQTRHLASLAVGQDAGRDHQRPGTGTTAGLVGTGDDREAPPAQRAFECE